MAERGQGSEPPRGRRSIEEARAAYARMTLASAVRSDPPSPGTPRQISAEGGAPRSDRRAPRARLLLLLAVAFAGLVSAASGVDRSPSRALASEITRSPGFVAAAGTGFEVDGEPWAPVGFNDYRLTSLAGGFICDESHGPLDLADLELRLDRVAAAGGNVVRTWMFQSYMDPDGDGVGDFGAFDQLLSSAEARGIRVVPVLANHWSDCENERTAKPPAFYEAGYQRPQAGKAFSYLEYAELIAARYADSPTIAFWELVNEPELSDGACDERRAARTLSAFTGTVAGAVRAVDPNHLVSLGTIGTGQCGTAGASYREVSAEVDICSVHIYDTAETGTSPLDPLPGGPEAAEARLADCSADGLDKPTVIGEIGMAADLGPDGRRIGAVSAETLARRAELMGRRLEALREAGIAGFMVWQLEGATPGHRSHDFFGVGPCDPVEAVVRDYGPDLDPATARLSRDLCHRESRGSLAGDPGGDLGSAPPLATAPGVGVPGA